MKRPPATIVLLAGILAGLAFSWPLLSSHAQTLRRIGPALEAAHCSWNSLLLEPLYRFYRSWMSREIRSGDSDPSLNLRRFSTPIGEFWIPRGGRVLDEAHLMGFLLSEQRALNLLLRGRAVRAGDVVVDVGAHIGTFGRDALLRGAARVVMVEPDPLNLECLRRNFSQEIASGKVVLIPKGAWSRPDRLRFSPGVSNSGTGSFVVGEDAGSAIEMEVDRLDTLLAQAGVTRVDFIKLDIEGAEREALRGAFGILRRDRPRILLDANHLPDDGAVLPAVIAEAVPAYSGACLACQIRFSAAGVAARPYAFLFEAPPDGANSPQREAR